MRNNRNLLSMTITALMIAVGMILPFFLGNVQVFMQGISPMHIPVFLCGLTCGPWWGLACGVILPILRSFTIGMPPFPNVALPMAFELGVYGLTTGTMYCMYLRTAKTDKHLVPMLIVLLISMVLGRIVGGITKAVLMFSAGNSYSISMFVNAYFLGTAVGAVIHLILVPAVTLAVERAGLSPLLRAGKNK